VMQVIANGISATPTPFIVSPTAPKIFSMDGSVCVAQNEDGALNSGANPIAAGHSVTVYLIGMGAVSPAVPTGAPAPATPRAIPSEPVAALFAGRSITPISIGLMPGYVGVGEVKLSVPAGTAEGFQDFAVTIGAATSNKCQIAVRK